MRRGRPGRKGEGETRSGRHSHVPGVGRLGKRRGMSGQKRPLVKQWPRGRSERDRENGQGFLAKGTKLCRKVVGRVRTALQERTYTGEDTR